MPAPDHSSVRVPFATQFDLTSTGNGRTYRIMVFKPLRPAPGGGRHPVIVTSDGNMTFPIAAALSSLFGFGGVRSAIVVGVGYPTDNPAELGLTRRRDLTPPTPLEAIQPQPGWPEPRAEDFGGAEAFLDFLVNELRPLIAERFEGDVDSQTLYGHSLGGLFTLYALFRRPDSFRNFVASSPSIWWNDRAILKDVEAFARRVEAGEVSPRVLITIGADEQAKLATPPPGMSREAADRLIAAARMVDNAAELGARLAALDGRSGYLARYRALDEDDHTTSLATSIGRALSFALRE